MCAGFAPTLLPARNESVHWLTLREELQGRYLAGMIDWLGNEGWQAAKSANSFWQIAHLGTVLIDWLSLQLSEQERTNNVRKILQTEIVPHILDSSRTDNNTVIWDYHVYDNSIVVTFLLKYIYSFYTHVPPAQKASIVAQSQKALVWITRDILFSDNPWRTAEASLGLADESMAMVVETLQTVKQLNWRTGRKFSHLPVDHLLTKLVQGLLLRANREDESPKWGGLSTVLPRLVTANTTLKDKTLRKALNETLLAGILVLERELQQSSGVGPHQVENLEGYIFASLHFSSVHKKHLLNDQIVIPLLYKHCWEIDVFDDGSIYHSLQVTTAFAGCLVELIAGNWHLLDMPMMKLYQTALQNTAISEQVGQLRQEIFTGLSRELDLERKLSQLLEWQRFLFKALSGLIFWGISLWIGIGFYNILGSNHEVFWTVYLFGLGLVGAGTARLYAWMRNRQDKFLKR